MTRPLILSTLVLLLAACGGQDTAPPSETPPTGLGPTINSFMATPGVIAQGETAALTWDVSADASTISISPGIGSVAGSSITYVAPSATTTYTLTATNAYGESSAAATVTVEQGEPNPPREPEPEPVPYGGEWVWEFESEYGFTDEGTISIFEEDTDDDDWEGSFGYWQSCYAGNCFNEIEGVAYIGLAPVEGEGVQLVTFLAEEDLAGNVEIIYATIDDNKDLAQDDQGRDEITGDGYYQRYGGELFGDGYTVLISQDRLFGPQSVVSPEKIQAAKQAYLNSQR